MNDFVFLLGLEEDAARRRLHGLEGKVGHTGPGKHHVSGLLEKVDPLSIKKIEGVSNVIVEREVLVRIATALFYPVLVESLGVLRRPNKRVSCRFENSLLQLFERLP